MSSAVAQGCILRSLGGVMNQQIVCMLEQMYNAKLNVGQTLVILVSSVNSAVIRTQMSRVTSLEQEEGVPFIIMVAPKTPRKQGH